MSVGGAGGQGGVSGVLLLHRQAPFMSAAGHMNSGVVHVVGEPSQHAFLPGAIANADEHL